MSNDVTTPDGEAHTGPPNRGRRKLWVAAGVAGLTGVVGLAALGGVAARDDDTSSGSGRPDAQSNARQNVSDAGKANAAADEGDKPEDDWSGGDWSGQDDHRDRKGRATDVPCDTDDLIQAIIHANRNDGGVLDLAKGCTYELTRSEHGNGLPVIKESIVLKGHDTKIVRAANAERFRILNVGRGGHLTLKGVTVKGGQTAAGGTTPQPAVRAAKPVARAAKPSARAAKPTAEAARIAAAAARLAARAATLPAGASRIAAEGAKLEAMAAKLTASAAPATGGRPASNGPTDPDVPPSSGSSDGAGVLVQRGGHADIEHSEIVLNQAGANGGGIANYGTTNIRKSLVERNSANGSGGGIFNAGVLRVEESKVVDNTSGVGGGGIANGSAANGYPTEGGTVWVWKSTIGHNRTNGLGGGVIDREGETTITHSRVTENTAGVDAGGVLALRDSKLSLEDTVVAKNHTAGEAGGVGIADGSTAVIEHSAIKENVADGNGGGLVNFRAFVTLRDSEVVGNQAVGRFSVGGGIVNDRGRTTLDRTKVAYNVATNRPGGIWTNNDGVHIDRKSAVTGNRPTNCKGSPAVVKHCFG